MEVLTPQVDDVDLRIRQAEEELTRLRKERALVELQNQLAEEQRLLANSHNAQPTSHTIHRADEPTDFLGRYPVLPFEQEAQPVLKRSDSELTLSEEDGLLMFPKHIPMLPVTKVYHGVNRKEFLLLMRRLEAHFTEWAHYYTLDDNKIAEACRHLSDGIATKWALVRLSPDDDRRTWPDFCVWLSSNIRNFVNPDVAERRYQTVRQRPNQPVSRYAALLGSLEANLPRLVTDYERCERLWEGVFPEIRNASRSGFPASFHTGISELCAAGRSVTMTKRGGRPRRRRGRRRAP